MSDQHKRDAWDQGEVEIVDLGTPDRGFSRYLFTLGEKWHVVASLLARFVTLLVALCLLIAVLLAGSSSVSNQPPGAPHAAPGDAAPSTIYLIDCGTTINVNSLPSQTYVWEQVMATPSTQECNFLNHPASKCPASQQVMATPLPPGQEVGWICSDATPLPTSAGKNGKNR